MSWYARALEVRTQAKHHGVRCSEQELEAVCGVIERRTRHPQGTEHIKTALERCTVFIQPEDVRVNVGSSPLVDVFYNVEREVAAAYVVLASLIRHNWDWIRMPECAEVMKRYIKEGTDDWTIKPGGETEEGYEWMTNPFCIPDMHGLVAEGYAEFGEPVGDGKAPPIRFTLFGLMCIQASQWIKKGRGT